MLRIKNKVNEIKNLIKETKSGWKKDSDRICDDILLIVDSWWSGYIHGMTKKYGPGGGEKCSITNVNVVPEDTLKNMEDP